MNDIESNIDKVNGELKNIENFCQNYGIDINSDKTKTILISSKNNMHKINYQQLPKITINGDHIDYVDSIRDLGYYLNRTITSENHTKIVQQKVYGAINSISPLKSILPANIKLQLYKSLILPIFDYMDIVYHNFATYGTNGESVKLERLQNMCIRYILNINRREHITPHRQSLDLLKLFDRRTLHVANMMNKIINEECPPYLCDLIEINANNTRSKNKLIVKKPKNNFQKTSFYISSSILWNKIPEEIRNVDDYNTFKEYFAKHLLNEA